ncbi:MAG: GlsB/YeaQ/YmgE family stress response membrane protein [Jatrophihabitans sp.]|uniref:GlsB/YeaQ/YmgE family stress response membrane protein n=1 Tax=Jatrophihabitans sp. TaxID=1932789 RepID=UPI003F81EC51
MLALLPVVLVLVLVVAIAGWALWLILSAAVVGAVIGALARLAVPGRQEIGIFNTIVIGWIGSLIGSLLGRHLFHVGRFLTFACEIGVAAVLVLLASSAAGNALARRNRSLRW